MPERRRESGILDYVVAFALAAAACALYLAFRNVFYSYDALNYAIRVEDGRAAGLFHPHHMLYNVLGWFAFRGARYLGYAGRSLGSMHVVNALAGGGGVAFLFLLTRRLGAKTAAALWAAVMLATASCYWLTAAGVGVYVPGVAAALGAAWAVVAAAATDRRRAAVVAGLACAFAAAVHQLNLCLIPAAVIYIYCMPGAKGRRCAWFGGALIGGWALLYVLLPALVCGFKSMGAYRDWFFSYARLNRWGGGAAAWYANGPRAFGRAFFVNDVGDNFVAPFAKNDWRYLRVALPLWLVAAGGLVTLAAWLARGPGRRILALIVPAFALTAAFILWWIPDYVGMWLWPAAFVPVALAAALTALPLAWRRGALAVLSIGWLGIVVINWRDGVAPRRVLAANADYRAGIIVARAVGPAALAYLGNTDVVMYARYFGGARRVQSPNWAVAECDGDASAAAGVIESRVAAELAAGRVVFIGERAFPGLGGEPFARVGRRWLARGKPAFAYESAVSGERVLALEPGRRFNRAYP